MTKFISRREGRPSRPSDLTVPLLQTAQTEALEQRGQDVIDEQKEHWSALVKAGKAAIQG